MLYSKKDLFNIRPKSSWYKNLAQVTYKKSKECGNMFKKLKE
jgi:hypothetical protein